ALGFAALELTTGSSNTGIGFEAGQSISSGYSNLMLGDSAGNITSGNANIGIGASTYFQSLTGSQQLNIGNLIFGNLPATTSAFQLPTSGTLGIGTSTPFGKFAISLNAGDTSFFNNAFTIASSTSGATTTLFNVSNTGSTTIANGVNITSGCFAQNGTCLTPFTGTAASSTLLTDNNTFTGRNAFSLIKLSATSSSLLASDNNGNVIATSTIGSNLISVPSNSLLAGNSAGQIIASSTIGWNLLKGPASSIFAFDASGNPIATTSIGVNYLSGVLPIANGGTNANTQTSNAVNFFNGTSITSSANLTFTGNTLRVGTSTPSTSA